MFLHTSLVGAALVASVALPSASIPEDAPVLAAGAEVRGLRLGVADVERSVAFYRDGLGFAVRRLGPLGASLSLDAFELELYRSGARAAAAGVARITLNLTVGELDAFARRCGAAGGVVDPGDVRESAVGPYLEVLDPDGHPVHGIDHPWDELEPGAPPALFNLGLRVLEHAPYESFFEGLGIGVATRAYLPRTLVLQPVGAAQLVLHTPPDPGSLRAPEAGEDCGTILCVSREPIVDAGRWPGLLHAEPGAAGWLELRTPDGVALRVLSSSAAGLEGQAEAR